MTALKGYRTLIVNTLAAVVPVLELTELTDVLPAHWIPWYALVLALANLGLRTITSTPVGEGT